MSVCPSPATLSHLARDSSSGLHFAAMEAHVQMCANCQEVLERMAVDASFSPGRGPRRLSEPERAPTIPGFVIERVIGRGGMGVVYRAWQPQLARHVAIKIVSASVGIDADARRRWLRESQAIGRVRHRNVVQLHEAGEQDGCLYLVLDLIAGGSLAERITGPLPARVAVGLMATIARAVDHIHNVGMLHLDIKPSNILLDGLPDGPWAQVTPMIADFGIARPGNDPGATVTGPIGVRGTPSFMAPEQIAGDLAAIGPRSDIFALGATLYSLLAGRPPFHGASVLETLDLVRTREPAPLRTLVPDLGRDLETIAQTCLRKEQRRRYASASALADDLDRWLDGFPIRARPVSKVEHVSRWCRRRPAVASLLLVLAITVVSSLVGLLTLWRHSEADRARAENAFSRALESEEATAVAVRDLVGLLSATADAPQMLVSERLEKSSHAVRDLTAKLRRNPMSATTNLVAICELERQLASDYLRFDNYAISTTLLMDSLDLLEGRRYGANDPDVDLAYAKALMGLGYVAHSQGRVDEGLVYYRRAEEALEGLVRDPRHVDAIISIDQSRRAIAVMFGRSGLEEPRRTLLNLHVRMLERLSEHARADPVIELLIKLARVELANDASERVKLRIAIQKFPVDRRLPAQLEQTVGQWIASDVNPYPSNPNEIGEDKGQVDADAHADWVIRALESRCGPIGVTHTLLPEAAMQVACIGAIRCKQERDAGRLADARRTAAFLSAFARRLERGDPDNATFHQVMCMAHEQESKIGWECEDYAAIEFALRNALHEALIVTRLDPRNAVARQTFAGLQDKLVRLVSERPSSR